MAAGVTAAVVVGAFVFWGPSGERWKLPLSFGGRLLMGVFFFLGKIGPQEHHACASVEVK